MIETTPTLNLTKKYPEQWEAEVYLVSPISKSVTVYAYISESAEESISLFKDSYQKFAGSYDVILSEAKKKIYANYQSMASEFTAQEMKECNIPTSVTADTVFEYITISSIEMEMGDKQSIYIKLLFDCEWEIEHGLQLVIKDGSELAAIGAIDGSLPSD